MIHFSKNNWTKCLVLPSVPILETLKIIDSAELQIALVVDENRKLLGTVTDGDIRRGILQGLMLTAPVGKVMNPKPLFAYEDDHDRPSILLRMKERSLRHIPILDRQGSVTGMQVIEDLLDTSTHRPNWVVLMAGGMGTRLAPLTDSCPKPLLSVGNRPLLETILRNFLESGFRNFFLSVNYKAQMIRDYFGDGSKWGCNIEYLHEDERLGTAGALSLLPSLPSHPTIVMNGDLLTKVNFPRLLDFHETRGAQATMCVREYDFQVPYGVVSINEDVISEINEKPVQRFFVNAGIYVLQPPVIESIPKKTYLDMPNLFNQLLRQKEKTIAFPIREYWLDIGQLEDFKRASDEFGGLFS